MNSYGNDFKKIERSLDSLNGKEYISEHTVRFFKNIAQAHWAVKSKLDQEDISWHLPEEEIKERMRLGKPLIAFHALPLQETLLKDLFLEICTIIKNYQESNYHELERLINAAAGNELSLRRMVEKFFYHDHAYFQATADTLALDVELLLFIALNLAKPFCETVVAKAAITIDEKSWHRNYCPYCGGGAHIARLEKEEGRRMLYCQLCGSEWRYMRVKCPFCCSEDQKKLKFKAEEKSPYRIDLCEQCGRYIKTIDERKRGCDSGEIIPSTEDLATLYLDIAAEKEGYVRSWFFPASAHVSEASEEMQTVH